MRMSRAPYSRSSPRTITHGPMGHDSFVFATWLIHFHGWCIPPMGISHAPHSVRAYLRTHIYINIHIYIHIYKCHMRMSHAPYSGSAYLCTYIHIHVPIYICLMRISHTPDSRSSSRTITHGPMGCDSFACATWLIHFHEWYIYPMGMSHAPCSVCEYVCMYIYTDIHIYIYIYICHMRMSHAPYSWSSSRTITHGPMGHDSFAHATCLNHMCVPDSRSSSRPKTHGKVVTWLISMRDMTHAYATRLIRMCAVIHAYVTYTNDMWRDAFEESRHT